MRMLCHKPHNDAWIHWYGGALCGTPERTGDQTLLDSTYTGMAWNLKKIFVSLKILCVLLFRKISRTPG